jgi:hypothetical protein
MVSYQLQTLAAFFHGKSPWYPLERIGWPVKPPGCRGEEILPVSAGNQTAVVNTAHTFGFSFIVMTQVISSLK